MDRLQPWQTYSQRLQMIIYRMNLANLRESSGIHHVMQAYMGINKVGNDATFGKGTFGLNVFKGVP